MNELNKANRQTCDVDIRVLKTMKPYLFFDTANTTTAGLSADNTYAMAKGAKRVVFNNPLDGTMSVEAQVYPFKLFAMLSDGTIKADAIYADKQVVKATAAGSLDLDVKNGEVKAGTVFAYPVGDYGNDDAIIEGSFADKKFTATESSKIEVGKEYEIGYLVSKTTGVKRISINNKEMPKDYYITQKTVEKDEDGVLTPFLMTAYKATIKRNLDLSFSSEGDPATVKLEFDLAEDKDGNVLDLIEITDEAE